MSAWLMSIVGVVALSVLLEIMLSDGETSKYIKGIFSLAVVLIIITPLPKFLMSDFDITKVFDSDKYGYDHAFVEKTAKERNTIREGKIVKLLEENHIKTNSAKVYFIGEKYSEIDIVKVYILNMQQANDTVVIVSNYLSIEKEKVVVYERK